ASLPGRVLRPRHGRRRRGAAAAAGSDDRVGHQPVRAGRAAGLAAPAAGGARPAAPRGGPRHLHVLPATRRGPLAGRQLATDQDHGRGRPAGADAAPPRPPRHGRPPRRPGRAGGRAVDAPRPPRRGAAARQPLPRLPVRRRRRPPAPLVLRASRGPGTDVRLLAGRLGRPAAGVPRRRRRGGRAARRRRAPGVVRRSPGPWGRL
ncbi:MAG: hypothetical protein AVDCRST_MAG32-2683, partial [uncultured Nocardioides sp.]